MTLAAWMGVWLQELPDMRSLSWWLPTGAARDWLWLVVLSLNLLVLLWLLYKMLYGGKAWSIPLALRGRGESIQMQLQSADRAHQEAQARLAGIEARIANLPAEVAALKREAEQEAAQEYERLVEASRREAAQIAQSGRREIEAASKLAQKELKGLAAALALDLARQRIQERMTPELDQAVVRGALDRLASGNGRGRAN